MGLRALHPGVDRPGSGRGPESPRASERAGCLLRPWNPAAVPRLPEQESRIALLAALGAAGEPLDGSALCSLAGLSDPALVDGLMRTDFGRSATSPMIPRGGPAMRCTTLACASTCPVRPAVPSLRRSSAPPPDRACLPLCAQPHRRSVPGSVGRTRSRACHPGRRPRTGRCRRRIRAAQSGGPPAQGRPGADVHKLLAVRSNQSSLWYAAHEHTWDTGGFLRDVELARAAAPSIAMNRAIA